MAGTVAWDAQKRARETVGRRELFRTLVGFMVSVRRRSIPQVCYGSPVARRPTVFTYQTGFLLVSVQRVTSIRPLIYGLAGPYFRDLGLRYGCTISVRHLLGGSFWGSE
jgi:hypothetical protein